MTKKLLNALPQSFDFLVRNYFILKSIFRYYAYTRKKGVNPLELYYTSPSRINAQPLSGFRIREAGKVLDGEWDQNTQDFENYLLHKSLVNRFENSYQWNETKWYKKRVEKVQNGEICWHGCSTVEDIKERCYYIDELYRSIKEKGYHLQSELNAPQTRKTRVYPSSQREISVNIGRNGQLLIIDGRHRLSIAKILDIQEIPIHITIVHADWEGGLPEGVYRKSKDQQ